MKQIENWKKVLIRNIKEALKKVRIRNNPKPIVDPRMSGLIDKLNKLVDEGSNKKEIDEIETAISDIEADINRNKIMENFKNIVKTQRG